MTDDRWKDIVCECLTCQQYVEKMKMREKQKIINEARQKREEFRAKLADLGRSEETTFSSRVLEAYDLVHCPELRDNVLTTLQAIMTETEIRQGLNTGMTQVGWITQYGAGCIVDALRNKGYEITKINQK